MEGDLIAVRYNCLPPQGTHHRPHNNIIPKRVGAGVVSCRRPAKLNEAPEIHRVSRAPDEKQRIEQREVVPLHSEFDDGRRRACGLSGQVIRPPLGLRPLRGGVEASAEVPEMPAPVQVDPLQDGCDMRVERPVIENDVLIVPDRNPGQGHAISPLAFIAVNSIVLSATGHRFARQACAFVSAVMVPAKLARLFGAVQFPERNTAKGTTPALRDDSPPTQEGLNISKAIRR